MPPSGLRIAAIHNGELDRSPAKSVIDALKDESTVTVEFIEQAPLEPDPNTRELIAWRRRQGDLETRWARYLGRPRRQLVSAFGQAAFEGGIRISTARQTSTWKVRQIEKAVTAKHVRAWRDFLESTDTELLILESDAGLTDSTTAVIQGLTKNQTSQPRYVNLAGGLDPHTLGIEQLATKIYGPDSRLTEFPQPITNTSCAYVINRPMAQLAIDHLEREPADAELGIDWLWNSIFLAHQGTKIECLHARPPAIIHGSMQGLTKSWHPQR